MTHPILIIGAGLAGWSTARELRKLDAHRALHLISADAADFYAKPSLSNAFGQRRSPAQLVSTAAQKMADTLGLTLHAHCQVLGIDPLARSVQTTQGEWAYSELVLATGAQPIRLPLAGDATDQVLSVNSLSDFATFHARLTEAGAAPTQQHIVIMGAGLIGCEFANDLAGAGYQVTVVDPSASPIAALLPEAVGAELRTALATLGVRWQLGATVQAVNYASSGAGAPALQVTLSNALVLGADVVLSAVGLRPNTTLAQAAGLACERGVLVDARLQTSAEHIYALGDGVQYASADNRTLPYVMPIMHAAKALAATLAGTPTEVLFPLMPVAIKTPALPLVVAPAPPGVLGAWQLQEPGVWQFIDPSGRPRGFVLVGAQTARRAEQARQISA